MKKILGLFLVTVLALAGCQQAEAPRNTSASEASYFANLPIKAANFQGTLSVSSVGVERGRLLVSGAVSYLHEGKRVTQRIRDVSATLTRANPVSTSSLAPQQDRTCSILFLDLDSLFLDLLGLQVDLSPVELSIDAVEGEDRLLGNLLCSLVSRDP